MGRFKYLGDSVKRWLDPARSRCPNCQSPESRVVDRKYLVTSLRRCAHCHMMFRAPTDPAELNEVFYEEEYTQGFTTDLPSDLELEQLLAENFRSSPKDYSYYVSILADLGIGAGARVFDYGCSWGYGSYQFTRAGMNVTAFEIAPTRRAFAVQKLGVSVVTDMDAAAAGEAHRGTYDCFFSSHVLEHVPAPSKAFALAHALLREGGLFVSFTPNGSETRRARSPDWSRAWGEVHPNLIDEVFLGTSFSASARAVGGSPVQGASLPSFPELVRLNDLSGGELFFAARKQGAGW